MATTTSFLHGVEIAEIETAARPIRTSSASVIGLIGTSKVPWHSEESTITPVLITSAAQGRQVFGEIETEEGKTNSLNAYTIPKALEGIFAQTSATVIVFNIGAGDTFDYNNQVHIELLNNAIKSAESVVRVAPRLLIAPEVQPKIILSLSEVAKSLRAIIIADAPIDTIDDALEVRDAYKNGSGDRIYLVAPYLVAQYSATYVPDPDNKDTAPEAGALVTVTTMEAPSARVAGVIAKSDNERGFWWSPSNRIIAGIEGTDIPISFSLGDTTSDANKLNENHVATVIYQDGYRLWGNRTCADGQWRFINVRRTADMINDALQRAHLWAVDRNITKTYLETVTNGVNKYLASLKARGAIIDGNCWVDEEYTTIDSIADGKVTFTFDFTPPSPAEHITFRSVLTNKYLSEVF